jgi:exopolyphosphatase/guanosine-5'-triphosphate,3'-diphosphate pyrophosphatase
MDLGSRSFHVLVAEVGPGGCLGCLARDKAVLDLGYSVARTGQVGARAAGRAVAVVRRFRRLAEALGADRVVAVGTGAFRQAGDGAELAERIRREAGVQLEVASGAREAELVFAGVRGAGCAGPEPVLAADLGAGSLEVMVGDAGGLRWSASLELGVARLTAELVRSDPLSEADRRALAGRIGAWLGPLEGPVAALGPRALVGSGGTLSALARMAAGARPRGQGRLAVGRPQLAPVLAQARDLPRHRRRGLEGADPARLDLLPAGSLVLEALMDRFGFDSLTLSPWGLREGMVLEALAAARRPAPARP